MSCSGAFDIYENGTYSECPSTEVCKYDYSYEYDRTSKCRVTKKSNYLKLLCWDRSNVTIANMKNLTLTEARLYSPSVNKWDGSKVAAELILSHAGAGKSVDVCIPIIKDDSSSDPSIKFFDAIHNAVRILPNERNGTMRSVELPANFSLDNIIPKGSFYLAEGDGMAINTCNPGMRNIIIFSKERAIKMKTKVQSDIANLVAAYRGGRREIKGSASARRGGGGKFWKNTGGTTKSNGDGFSAAGQMAMECEPVNNSNTGNNVGIKKNPTVDAAGTFSGMNGEEIFMKYGLPAIYFILSILGVFVVNKIAFVFPYPHFRESDNAKGKKVSKIMYWIGHIPGLGQMIVGKDGLSRMKGGTGEEED